MCLITVDFGVIRCPISQLLWTGNDLLHKLSFPGAEISTLLHDAI